MTSETRSVRTSTIAALADRLLSFTLTHPVRVAIDGRSASGKTTFADELAVVIMETGRSVVRASIDDFHHPSVIRHRQGRRSPNGYYEDARDLEALRELLLEPMGPNGSRQYVVKSFDLDRDQPMKRKFLEADNNSVLIIDGTFLQRPELRAAWDYVVFLAVPSETARNRAVNRDCAIFGGRAAAEELYLRRYDPASARYELECSPEDRADAVMDNWDFDTAAIVRMR